MLCSFIHSSFTHIYRNYKLQYYLLPVIAGNALYMLVRSIKLSKIHVYYGESINHTEYFQCYPK